jgi:hypothetical protein
MKKIFLLLATVFFCWFANAQVTGNQNNLPDSARHHNMHRDWNRSDSSHKKFDRFRDQGMNRFRSRDRENKFRSFDRNRSGWANAHHVRYTPEQRKQMRMINEDYRKKSQDLYKQDNITLREYKSQLIALQKDRKSKMQNLLTPDQKNEMEKWKKHASEEAQVRAAANLERMKIHLNLSDDQAAKIKAQQISLRSQMKSIHENDNLLPYQKKEQMKALIAKRNDAIKSVLTADQLSEFEKMHSRKFGERFDRSNTN